MIDELAKSEKFRKKYMKIWEEILFEDKKLQNDRIDEIEQYKIGFLHKCFCKRW